MNTKKTKKRYVPILINILIPMLIISVVVPIVLSLINYYSVKSDLYENFDQLQENTENNIRETLRLLENSYAAISIPFDNILESYLNKFLRAYERTGRNASWINLESLKKEFGDHTELYIINSDYVIEYTTNEADLNLDFKQFEEFHKSLKKIMKEKKFHADKIVPSTTQGIMTVYGYLPTPDSKYILEVGITYEDINKYLGALDPVKLTEKLKDFNKYLEKINMFRVNMKSVYPSHNVTDEQKVILKRFFANKNENIHVEKTYEDRMIRYIYVDLYDKAFASDNSKVIELVYNTEYIKTKLKEDVNFYISLVIVSFVVGVLISTAVSLMLAMPIHKIISDIDIISDGDLDHIVKTSTVSELKVLEHSVNKMVYNMKSYIVQIEESELKIKTILNKVEKQNIKLQELDGLKDQFLANTSHELKTPLNVIRGLTDLMLRKIDNNKDTDKANQKKLLGIIMKSTMKLTNQVNSILDFSKAKSKKMKLNVTKFNLSIIATNIIEFGEGLLIDKNVELIVDIPDSLPDVYGDTVRVEQIFYNLISNSVKFTKDGNITVKAAYDDPYIKVSISDTGIGINKDFLTKIFSAFEQEDSSKTKEYGGTGLGLSISKLFVEMHGGTISVESEEGFGSTFVFTLPVRRDLITYSNVNYKD